MPARQFLKECQSKKCNCFKNPERNAINYEVISITMPFVFLGSFYGVIIGKIIGDTAQTVIYGVTVAWSIYTTMQKVI